MVLATAPVLAVIPLMLTIRQVPAIPPQGGPWSLPSSHLASVLYLVLSLAFVTLVLTILWGYASLSKGILESRTSGRGLRVLARTPRYLICLSVALYVASAILEPHAGVTHGNHSVPLNGHPDVAHALSLLGTSALGACWLISIVLLRAVAHGAVLPFASLISGKRVSSVVSSLLWLMTGATLALSSVYAGHASYLRGITIQSAVFGRSLLLLGILLFALSFASTLGAVLATRSWKVTNQLIR